MKYSLGYCLLLCLLLTRVQTKPQITKLLPIEDSSTYDHQKNNETGLFDKLLGKLRETYNFVLNKTNDDVRSNIEKIFTKEPSNTELSLDAYKFNRANPISTVKLTEKFENSKEENPLYQTRIKTLYDTPRDDRYEELQPLEPLEPLEPLDFVEEEKMEDGNKKNEVEFITPSTGTHFSTTLGRHFVEWLGSLLGTSYGIYVKFTKAFHNNNTIY